MRSRRLPPISDEKFIIEALGEKGRGITLIQCHHAEDNSAVAAASLLAKDPQKSLSAKYSIPLPRGATGEAVIAGRDSSPSTEADP